MTASASFVVTDVRLPDSDVLVDVFVDSGTISRLAPANTVRDGRQEHWGAGHLVLPRFIDVHSHADARVWSPDLSVSKSAQGIGHEIVGNCGLGPAPSSRSEGWRAILSGVGISNDSSWNFADLSEYESELQTINRGLAPRLSTLLPYGAVRAKVAGLRRELEPSELTDVASEIDSNLDAAVGVSMGLVYPPNAGATRAELERTLAPLSGGGVLAVHVRSQANWWIEAIDEVLQLTATLGMRLLISHLSVGGIRNQWKVDWVLARLAKARDEGVDVYFDQHPYSAGSTSFTQLIPGQFLESGTEGVEVTLSPRDLRELLENPSTIVGWENYFELVGANRILIAGSEVAPQLAGLTVDQVAASERIDPVDAVGFIIAQTDGRATMVVLDLYDDERIEQIIRDPSGMISTDSVHVALPHPRLYGTYPYAFSRFVTGGIMSESDFVRKTFSLPAEVFGFLGGGVDPGHRADFLVVDAAAFGHQPDYLNPSQPVNGIVLQVIDGQVVAASS